MNIIAITMAKKESTRLLNKNTREFCGLPLVAWTVIQGVTAEYVDSVYVSVDSEEIAEIAREHGGIPIFRRGMAQRQDATGGIVMRDAIDQIRDQRQMDLMVDILPTSPLRKPGEIDDVIEMYYQTTAARVTTTYATVEECYVYSRLDEHRAELVLGTKSDSCLLGGNMISAIHPDHYGKSYRKLPPLVVSEEENNAQIEAAMVDGLIPKENRIVLYYKEVEWWQHFDIDYQDEFDMCASLMEDRILKGRGAEVYYEYQHNSGGRRHGLGHRIKTTAPPARTGDAAW